MHELNVFCDKHFKLIYPMFKTANVLFFHPFKMTNTSYKIEADVESFHSLCDY